MVDNANRDSLLVEVDADEIHGGSPFVETVLGIHHSVYHVFKGISPFGFGLLHSFTRRFC